MLRIVPPPWRQTEFTCIYRRRYKYKVSIGNAYHGTYTIMRDAPGKVESLVHKLERDRTKREDADVFLEKACIYFSWVCDTFYQLADLAAHREHRLAAPHLLRAAPCCYQIVVESK